MAAHTISIAPPNSLVLISDARSGSVPDPEAIARDAGITSTTSCVAVCCLPEIDGETEITLGAAHEIDPGETPSFDAQLATPTRRLQVVTIEWKPILKTAVAGEETRVRIWVNRSKFPDKILIGVD